MKKQSLRDCSKFNFSNAQVKIVEKSPIIEAQRPVFSKRIKTQEPAEVVHESSSEKFKVKKKILDEMRANKFNINIYTLLYEMESKRKSPEEMSFNVLHEVADPQGVFIIIESNAELKPPVRTCGQVKNVLEEAQDLHDELIIENVDNEDL